MKRSQLLLQLVGWTLVIGLHFAMELASAPSLEVISEGDLAGTVAESGIGMVTGSPWEALARDAWVGLAGCMVSFGLWAAYRKLPLPGSGIWLAAGAVVGSVVGAVLWYAAADFPRWVVADQAAGRASGFDQSALLLKLFIMGAWHGVALALAQAERAGRAERLAQEARLEALRYQLNPHFLFNALNSVVAMIDEAPTRAQTMLTQLSGLLRRTLREAATTTLGEELELVMAYVELERVRYEENLVFELSCAEEARACRLPALTVHVLVENAVKHGMRSSSMPLRVGLACKYDEEWLHIEVRNGGRLEGPRSGPGIGTRNLSQRLETLYPGRHRFSLEESGGEVRASLAIRRPEPTA